MNLEKLQNLVLDAYNDSKISKKEMINILNWTLRVKGKENNIGK
jgi:hypothetical protein